MASWPRVQISKEERARDALEKRTNLPKLSRYAAFTSYSLGFEGGAAGLAAGIFTSSRVAVITREKAKLHNQRRGSSTLLDKGVRGDPGRMLSPSKN